VRSGPINSTIRRIVTLISNRRDQRSGATPDGKIDAFCASTGTGGTLAGIARYLKSKSDAVRIVLVDPPGSALYHYIKDGELKTDGGSSITEGIGTGRVTANLEGAPIDDALRISDAQTMHFVYRLLREEGLLLGSTSGINVAAAVTLAKQMGPGSHHRHHPVRRRREVSIAPVQQGVGQGAGISRGDRLNGPAQLSRLRQVEFRAAG
jgi:cysteine synthase